MYEVATRKGRVLGVTISILVLSLVSLRHGVIWDSDHVVMHRDFIFEVTSMTCMNVDKEAGSIMPIIVFLLAVTVLGSGNYFRELRE